MNESAGAHRLEAALRDLRAAAELVRSGQARTVKVSGFAYGEQLIAAARDIAATEGVIAEPIWWTDDAGADILVRSIDDAPDEDSSEADA